MARKFNKDLIRISEPNQKEQLILTIELQVKFVWFSRQNLLEKIIREQIFARHNKPVQRDSSKFANHLQGWGQETDREQAQQWLQQHRQHSIDFRFPCAENLWEREKFETEGILCVFKNADLFDDGPRVGLSTEENQSNGDRGWARAQGEIHWTSFANLQEQGTVLLQFQ